MFYAGDEIADDDCTSGPLAWVEQFHRFDGDDFDAATPFDPFEHLERHAFLDGIEAD